VVLFIDLVLINPQVRIHGAYVVGLPLADPATRSTGIFFTTG
jgi:hypothetical protein